MPLIAERPKFELAAAAFKLVAQGRKPVGVDLPGPQEKSVRALFQFKLVAGPDPQRIQHPRREGHLPPPVDLEDHPSLPTALE